MVVDIEDHACPCCRNGLHWIGEDVSERLDIVPAQLRVIVVRGSKYACRACEDVVVQAPAPARLIEGGLPTEATVAQVLGKTVCPPASERWLALHCASEGCSGGPSRSSSQEDEPWQIIGKHFVGIDVAKLRNAIAIADSGREGEVRFFGEVDASDEPWEWKRLRQADKSVDQHAA
jgi:hypothetical protein